MDITVYLLRPWPFCVDGDTSYSLHGHCNLVIVSPMQLYPDSFLFLAQCFLFNSQNTQSTSRKEEENRV